MIELEIKGPVKEMELFLDVLCSFDQSVAGLKQSVHVLIELL